MTCHTQYVSMSYRGDLSVFPNRSAYGCGCTEEVQMPDSGTPMRVSEQDDTMRGWVGLKNPECLTHSGALRRV